MMIKDEYFCICLLPFVYLPLWNICSNILSFFLLNFLLIYVFCKQALYQVGALLIYFSFTNLWTVNNVFWRSDILNLLSPICDIFTYSSCFWCLRNLSLTKGHKYFFLDFLLVDFFFYIQVKDPFQVTCMRYVVRVKLFFFFFLICSCLQHLLTKAFKPT